MADTLRVSNLSSTSGSVALTINNDQSLIGYGDHWNVGNVNGSGQSGNWSTFGVNWYAPTGFGTNTATANNYRQCCISWNGQYVLFTAYNNGVGPLFSNNGGYTVATVSPTAVGAGNFYGCAMSASGQYTLVANLTTVYLSSNFLTMGLAPTYSSAAYTSVLSVTSTYNSLSMSASGQYAVFAYTASATTGGIHLSSNYGVTWALVSGTNYPWQSVSMSSSGQYITACCNGTPNNIYISSNGGASFSLPATALSTVAGWTCVKVSSSGQYQVACANNYVYYSADYGMTWTVSSMSSSILWGCVAISPSGKYMLAASWGNPAYVYTNYTYGAGSWTQQASSTNTNLLWMTVSSTGTIAYVSDGGTIKMSALTTAAAPLLAPALAMGTNPNATSNAMLSVYTANTSGVGTGGGGAIALGMNYGSPATGLFGGVGDKLILYHGTASSYPYSIGVDTSKFYCSAPTGVSYGWIIGGTQRMTLDSSGNVGIGVASPSGPLHVNANTSTSGTFGQTLVISSPLGNVAARPAISVGAANTSIWGANTLGTTADDGFLRIAAGGGTGATTKSYIDISGYSTVADMDRVITLGTAGAERMRINSLGYVGIGTASPTSLLHMYSTAGASTTATLTITNGANSNTNYGSQIVFSNISAVYGVNLPLGSIACLRENNAANYSAYFAFSLGNIAGNGATYEVMRITSNGYVGIGTNAPIAALSIQGGFIGVNSVTRGHIVIQDANTITRVSIGHDTSYNYLQGWNSLPLFINPLGNNVGIGTGSANATLQVNGSLAKSSGTFDIEHPLYPSKRLVHSFIEGPRCDLIYRGKTTLINGTAVVDINKECTHSPECAMDDGTFEALCSNAECFLQNKSGFSRVIGSISGGSLTINAEHSNCNDTIVWMVIAERADPFIKKWDRTNPDGYLITQYTGSTASTISSV